MTFDVLPLHAENPGPMTGAGNWTYLLPGREAVLVDAGVGHPVHVERVSSAVPEGPGRVVVTHAHSDHASGAATLARRFPRTRFAKLPWPDRDAEFAVPWEWLHDEATIETGSGPLVVVHTPGHAPDHVALWHPPSRTIFTGDLLIQGSTVVVPASRGGRLRDYLRSLERVAALQPVRALPAHGPAIEDPLALIAVYRAHREARERQVLEAVGGGAATPDGIVARLYADLAPALVSMAQESVRAHLEKLRDEGRVIEGPGGWQLTA